MRKSTKWFFGWLSVFGLLFGLAGLVQASEMPEAWPWHGVSLGFPEATTADIARYHQELGIDTVRLQLKFRRYAKRKNVSTDQAWKDGIAWANEMLDRCAALNVRAILNISGFPLDPARGLKQTQARFWGEASNLDGVVLVAERLSLAFRKRGKELAAYDLMSEPVIVEGRKSSRPEAWSNLLRRIVDAIRKRDRLRWIVAAPGPWGGPNGYDDFEPVMDKRVIYGVHVYSPHRFTHQGIRDISIGAAYPGRIGFRNWNKKRLIKELAPLRRFQQQYVVPVMVGEFSAVRWAKGGEQYVKDLASIFDEYGWSWLYFSGTGWHGWNPDYNSHYPGKTGESRKDYVGDKSERWQTLREIFHVTQGKK